jgi:hypothetical protein
VKRNDRNFLLLLQGGKYAVFEDDALGSDSDDDKPLAARNA